MPHPKGGKVIRHTQNGDEVVRYIQKEARSYVTPKRRHALWQGKVELCLMARQNGATSYRKTKWSGRLMQSKGAYGIATQAQASQGVLSQVRALLSSAYRKVGRIQEKS